MNSLVDPEVIRALYRASQAGVKVDLLVRGICCLRPGIAGVSENIQVLSVVDRFLEHARIFYFQAGGKKEVYLGSADWMPRNFIRRVEVMFPVEDPALRDRMLDEILRPSLADNVKARRLLSDGSYERLHPPAGDPAAAVRSQQRFMELARTRAAGATVTPLASGGYPGAGRGGPGRRAQSAGRPHARLSPGRLRRPRLLKGRALAKPARGDGLIYLIRHGRAEDTHPQGDEARGLTGDGRRAFRALAAEVVRKLGLRGIATSPLVRAVQTAELLAAAAGIEEVQVRGTLAYEQASGAGVLALARALGPGWALVGHNPSMGEALARALGLATEAARFRKGAIAALQPGPEEDKPWRLEWVISPGRDFETTVD